VENNNDKVVYYNGSFKHKKRPCNRYYSYAW
jgi:hypothetical protein